MGLPKARPEGRVRLSPLGGERGFAPRPSRRHRRALPRLALDAPLSLATEAETESHGLSTFGELKYPADFKHFDYVNPAAPKGGTLALQIKRGAGNQNFDTFNTLNIFVLKGDGAAGMDATFDSLMAGSGDDPDGLYGLLAHKVRWSADKLTYRFLLRPEARFHDGSRVTARDAAFSINILKTKGHPSYRSVLSEVLAAEAESDDVLKVQLSPKRSRDLHLIVGGNPVFSEAYWRDRDFEASTLEPPLASGPYKVGRFEQGRFIEFDRVPDYWGRDLPVNLGQNNFDKVRYEYFRDRQVAFEAFKSGVMNYHEEFTARTWATGYDFPAFREGRVKREVIDRAGAVPTQGWYFNTRREMFKDRRIREAIGLAFDFEWTNQNIMFGLYRRAALLLRELGHEGRGPARRRRSCACSSRSAARCRTRSSASPTCRRSPTAPAAIATSCAAPTRSCARPAASARAPSSSCRTASRSRSSSSTTRHRCSRIRSRSRRT